MTTLGKYEIVQEIGRGGFGVVYQACDILPDRVVALKILHPSHNDEPRFIRRFRQEARVAARLNYSPWLCVSRALSDIGHLAWAPRTARAPGWGRSRAAAAGWASRFTPLRGSRPPGSRGERRKTEKEALR